MGVISRRFPLLSPTFLLRRKAITEGLIGGNRTWQIIGALILARRIVRKILGADPQTVAVERLEPGQSIILTSIRPRRSR